MLLGSIRRSINATSTVSEDDRRLLKAAGPVLLLANLFIASFMSAGSLPSIWPLRQEMEQEAIRKRIYPVLIEQETQKPSQQIDEISALAKADARGQGAITQKPGFHTLTKYHKLRLVNPKNHSTTEPKSYPRPSTLSQKHTKPEEQANPSRQTKAIQTNFVIHYTKHRNLKKASNGKKRLLHSRVPSNYRFRQDFLLRFDSSSLLVLASQSLVGFDYFRKMLRQMRQNFVPPGINYIIYDPSGYVLKQVISPQVVQVAFTLDSKGNVSDVRKLSSIGQFRVDRACLDTLKGKNFGKPPLEIFDKGNVFGIRFVFPDMRPSNKSRP